MDKTECVKEIIKLLERTPDKQLIYYIYSLLKKCT